MFDKFSSEENKIERRSTNLSRSVSPMDEKSAAEWYTEYRNQSFQNTVISNVGRHDYKRSKSQFDAHIAEIKGTQYIDYIDFFFSIYMDVFVGVGTRGIREKKKIAYEGRCTENRFRNKE